MTDDERLGEADFDDLFDFGLFEERAPEADDPFLDETPLKDALEESIDEWTVGGIVATMVPLLALMSLLQMGSGTVLESFEEQLLSTPSLLILVPVQIGTAGNLGSILCARLSTQLHLGTFELSPDNPELRANVGAVLALGATVFVLSGVAAWAIGRALGGMLGPIRVLFIAVASGLLLSVFVVVVSISSVYASYRLGLDPDDTTIPVVTNVCDITGVLILFAIVWVVL